MAASIKEIVNSCLSLVNNNNGLFKSEKQAKFLSGSFVDGSLAASVAYSFGEFNGCTRRVDYVITINEIGIQKIIKNGAVHWENTPEQISKQNAAKAHRTAVRAKEIQNYNSTITSEIEAKAAQLEAVKNSTELMDFVKTMAIEKLTKEIEELKSLLQ